MVYDTFGPELKHTWGLSIHFRQGWMDGKGLQTSKYKIIMEKIKKIMLKTKLKNQKQSGYITMHKVNWC